MVIVGEKEQQDGTVAVRLQGGGEQSVKTIQEFIDEVNSRVAEMTKDF
jgi:threonyl-tRNA synthetase